MNRFVLLLFFLAVLLARGLALAAPAEIRDIRLETTATPKPQETIRIRMNTLHEPEVFGIQGDNPRLVCDFSDTRPARDLKKSFEAKGNLIKDIRVGVHDKPHLKTRLVLDLFPNQDYTIHQIADQRDNLFTIIVELADLQSEKEGATAE